MHAVHLENKKVSRNFFIFLWVTYAVLYMTKNCFSAALAAIVDQGAMTKSQTGLIIAVSYIVYAPLQVVGGMLADRYDPEKLVKIGLLGSAVANLVIFFNRDYYVMLITWALNAAVQFAVWPAIFKIVSSQLVRSDRKSAAFYLSFSTSGGLLLAYAVAAFIPRWEYNFLISSILLLAFAVALHFICKKVDRYFVTDEPIIEVKKVDAKKDGFESPAHIFWKSGFYIFVVIGFLRTVVELGTKAFAPTMLMESYESISPTIGNLLNIIIIICGIAGTFVMRALYSKKIIKTELGGMLMGLMLALPFAVILIFIGKIPSSVSLISMCVMIFMLTSVNLCSSYFNMHFEKYGQSGTAAGMLNAAASFGVVFESYGMGLIADNAGWKTVSIVSAAFIAISILLSFVTIHIWTSFMRKTY